MGPVQRVSRLVARHGVGDARLAGPGRVPEILVEDPQFGNVGDLPFGLRIGPGEAFARGRILDVGAPVPGKLADIESVVENTSAARRGREQAEVGIAVSGASAGGFHGRVRDGIGCGSPAMATRSSSLSGLVW